MPAFGNFILLANSLNVPTPGILGKCIGYVWTCTCKYRCLSGPESARSLEDTATGSYELSDVATGNLTTEPSLQPQNLNFFLPSPTALDLPHSQNNTPLSAPTLSSFIHSLNFWILRCSGNKNRNEWNIVSFHWSSLGQSFIEARREAWRGTWSAKWTEMHFLINYLSLKRASH